MNENRKKRGNVRRNFVPPVGSEGVRSTAASPQVLNKPISRGRFLKTVGIGAAAIGAAAVGLGKTVGANNKEPEYTPSGTCEDLTVPDHGTVTICRDEFGVPHIYSDTDYGLYYGLGYAQAYDRLWQLEVNRISVRGRAAEYFGRGTEQDPNLYLNSDIAIRAWLSYPEEDLQWQYDQLTPLAKTALDGFAAGINRYIVDKCNPANPNARIPVEYLFTGITPSFWAPTDVIAFLSVMTVNFGVESPHDSIDNLFLLQALSSMYDPYTAYSIFNDCVWLDDPDAHTSVPSTQGKAQRKFATPDLQKLKAMNIDLSGISRPDIKKAFRSIGAFSGFGSYGAIIHPSRVEGGRPLIMSFNELGFIDAPPSMMEAQLTGGESNYNFKGRIPAGTPFLLGGQSENISYYVTSGLVSMGDYYYEAVIDPTAYLFRGIPVPFEDVSGLNSGPVDSGAPPYGTFKVRGEPDVTIPLVRSVHGPLMPGSPISFKKSVWKKEYQCINAVFEMPLANNIEEFRIALRKAGVSFNWLFASQQGTKIAYFASGEYPVRNSNWDPRLLVMPDFSGYGQGLFEWEGTVITDLDGNTWDGSSSVPLTWKGGTNKPNIECVNPSRGWLASWNNKPSADFSYLMMAGFNNVFKGYHYETLEREIEKKLIMKKKLNVEDAKEIYHYASRNNAGIFIDVTSGIPFHLLPYLMDAISPYRTEGNDTTLDIAYGVLSDWDGYAFDHPTITLGDLPVPAEKWGNYKPGRFLFTEWADKMCGVLFNEEVIPRLPQEPPEGPQFAELYAHEYTWPRLLHILDYELTGYSGVPPVYDYFANHGIPPRGDPNRSAAIYAFILNAFNEVLLANPESESWGMHGREFFNMGGTLGGMLGTIGAAEWPVIVNIWAIGGESINRLHVGQSGHIGFSITEEYQPGRIPLGDIDGDGNIEYVILFPDPHFFDQLLMTYNFEYKPCYLIPRDKW